VIREETFKISSEDELSTKVIPRILPGVKAGDWFWLEGELGAGKTTFVRHFLRGLGYEHHVVSPTYSLLVEYETEKFSVIHMDGYRLSSELETQSISQAEMPWDPREWGDAVVFVEWAEKTRLPRERFQHSILFEMPNEGTERRLLWKVQGCTSGIA